MKALDEMMRSEQLAGSPCKLTVTLLRSGEFSARMSFAPGMETASGMGATVEAALRDLADELT